MEERDAHEGIFNVATEREQESDMAGASVQKAVGDNDTQVRNVSAETGNHRSEKLGRTWKQR